MYYVIKKQVDKLPSTFMGFAAPKYIASRQNEHVIFLFQKEDRVIRKWVKLDEIILLTEDKDYFLKIMKQFKKVEEEQQNLVDEAHKKLEESMTNFTETMYAQINEYEEIKNSSDVPDLLKNL